MEDRRRKIVHPSVFSSATSEEDHVRQRHGSTRRRRLREADGISCSRISINQVTMRQRPASDGKSSCTELARRHITTPVVAPQRVFIAIGKGRERYREGIYRSRDRWHAHFRHITFPTGVEKWTERQWRRASRRPVNIEIARRDVLSLALVSCSLPSRLRLAANKFAWTKSGARVP